MVSDNKGKIKKPCVLKMQTKHDLVVKGKVEACIEEKHILQKVRALFAGHLKSAICVVWHESMFFPFLLLTLPSSVHLLDYVQLNFPFIVDLVNAYQDNHMVYMLMEFCAGGFIALLLIILNILPRKM